MNLSAELTIETPANEPVIRFRRAVAATPEGVFAAWTEPAQLRRWWGPPEWTLVVCEVDLRVGGGYRFVHRDADGTDYGTRGTYLRIEPARMLVNTFLFDGAPDRQSVDTVEFQQTATGTLIRGISEHQSIADRDAHVAGGMERGMRDTHHRLDILLIAARPIPTATSTTDASRVDGQHWSHSESSEGH